MNNHQIKIETIEANPVRGFVVMGLGGGVPFVAPYGATLSPDQAATLVAAGDLARSGREAVASALCARIQRDLGVTQELHIAGVLAGAQRLALQQRRAKAAAKAAQGKRLEALRSTDPEPSETVAWTTEEVARLHDALADVRARIKHVRTNGGLLGELGALRKKRDLIFADLRTAQRRASEGRRVQTEEAWLKRAGRETLDLARGRGEEVVIEAAETGVGRGRIKSRDGLHSLFETRALTPAQWNAGRAYRLCFEAASAGLKIANLQGAGGGCSAGAFGRSAGELRRAYLMSRLAGFDQMLGAGRKGRARLAIVRAVAGEGRTVGELAGGSGDGHARRKETLIEGLDLIVQTLGLANQEA